MKRILSLYLKLNKINRENLSKMYCYTQTYSDKIILEIVVDIGNCETDFLRAYVVQM